MKNNKMIITILVMVAVLISGISIGTALEGKIFQSERTKFLNGVFSSPSDASEPLNDYERTKGNLPQKNFELSTYREENALDNYPLLVGGMAHGQENIHILAQLGIGNFVWIPKEDYGMGNTPWDEENGFRQDVDAALANDFYFMISSRRGLGEQRKAGGYSMGGDTELFKPADPDLKDYISTQGGKYFIGYQAEELDADLVQSSIQPAFSDRNHELFNYKTPEQGRINYENELIRLQEEAHANGGMFISNQTVTHHLNAFRAGNDIVLAEMLEHLPNTQLQMAYLRGGAQQFGGNWGIWASPWYDGVPTADKGLWPASAAQPGLGHKPSSLRKVIYEAYVSGARVFTAQETEPLFSREGDSYKDVLWGTELKNFWEYAKDYQEEMDPIVSTALLIDRDNGWEPGNLWGGWSTRDSVWGKLSTTLGDTMFAKYLNTFIPSYAHTSQSVSMQKDLYPGFFTITPTGPFDVVASDIHVDRLRKYPVVVLMGAIDMNKTVLDNLKQYVEYGGTLVINSTQLMSEGKFMDDPEFFGYQLRDFSENWLLTNRVNNTGLITLSEDFPYMPKQSYSGLYSSAVNGIIKGGDVVATDANRMPVVVKNDFGAGKVYLTLTNYMMDDAQNPGPLEFYNDFLRSVVLNANSLVKVKPAANSEVSEFSWVSAHQGYDNVVVQITNNTSKEGIVEVEFNGDFLSANVDIGPSDFTQSTSGTVTKFNVKVSSDDITILRIKR